MAPDAPLSLAEVEAIALGKVDRITREYWTNGAGENQTVRDNASAFDDYRIRPRVLRDVRNVDMSTTVLGHRVSIPVGIAPSGWHKMADPAGEAGTARAANAQGTVMGVSMGTFMGNSPAEVCSPEEVKAAGGDAVKFFQLYIFKDREATRQVLRRVEAAGYEAVMLTVDTAHVGRRVSEIRNRPLMPRFLRVISFGSQVALSKEEERGLAIDAGLVWEDIIPWLRRNTKMQIWLKGVMSAEDAALAVSHGVDGIIVSNHGGRQLDGCVATLEALPEVVAAVKGAIPVHLDGGIRRGGDIFRALALGADYVWVGRPALWGLAHDGQRGVEVVLGILREELRFDYCDPENTFATSVSQRALSSPPLLYAILATSARHLGVTTGGRHNDGYLADQYHRECLALLIPILDDSTAAFDESLFAATVILRLYEEISVPFAGQDIESHLRGTHTFVRAQELAHRPSGIRQAALRVVLRQEIVTAFRNQRPVQLLREYAQVDQSLDPGGADDWASAFHVIVLCAEVLTCCYGDEAKARGAGAAWEELSRKAQRWADEKPVSFEPLLRRAPGERGEDQVFPEIWLLNDCHAAAWSTARRGRGSY
ncbi:uncharacterized protein DNG_05951 [Cephalotrichum gorgonifer]|uniref:Oxidase FUB9 n=1 Tax=Cephalotrichum gorgonifer TaxID=2041049 RepID=A0AAE8SW62_9PEZI|nr:uncharacterized protein DNG_05951 [Cephalotrichum gorgonifer]